MNFNYNIGILSHNSKVYLSLGFKKVIHDSS